MPGLDETENEFRWRLKDPSLFSEFRRKDITTGVSLLLGKLKESNNWEAQALRFDKNTFDKESARKWIKDHKGEFKENEEVHFDLPQTYDISNVEIFSAGKWNGDMYTEQDLEMMETGFNETRNEMKPYLKLGHSDEQKLAQNDGLPSIGWVESVKKVGRKLVANFVKVPQKIYELIKAGGYRRVSSEVYFNMNVNGKKYPRLLKAVSLLGSDTPAVQDLNDIIALYSNEYNSAAYNESGSETRIYNFDSLPVDDKKIIPEGKFMEGESSMDELKKQYEEMCAKFEALAGEKKKADDMCKQYEEQIAKMKCKQDEMDAQLKKNAMDALSKEINGTIDKLISEKHIAPAEREQFYTLLFQLKTAEGEVKKFKVGDKEQSLEDMLMGLVISRTYEINTDAKSAIGDSPNGADNAMLAEKAKKYSEENKVSYKEALRRVSQ